MVKKRILFVSPTGTLDNGAEKSTLQLMAYLVTLGYKIYNAYPENGHPSQSLYQLFLNENKIESFSLPYLKWWWEEAPGEKRFKEADRNIFYHKNIQDLREIIKQEDIDLVISNTVNVFQGAIAASCEEKAHIWLIHEFPREEFSYYKNKVEIIQATSDNISTVRGALNSEVKNLFGGFSKISSFLPYSIVDQSELKKASQKRLVSIGRISHNKNQYELLQAYAKLGDTELPLVFIGDWDEDEKKKCDAFIKDNNLKQVTFLGYQSKPWDYISDSDICILNSKSESLSLVYIEAVLKGIPIIASNNEGYTTVKKIFKSGLIYELGNVDQLQEKIASVLSNYSMYKNEALRWREFGKELYTLENCYGELVSVIENLTDGCPKILYEIQNLFGNDMSDHPIFKKIKEYVTIFYTTQENEEFSETNILKFPLGTEESISFELPEKPYKMRVDIGEFPGIYSNVTLTTQSLGALEMSYSSGKLLNDTFVFSKNDPQIIFETANIKSKQFTLTYKIEKMFSGIGDKVLLNYLMYGERFEEINRLQEEKIKLLEEEKQEMADKYHAVISSRRWIIPTKIINFIRRKK